MSKQKTSTVVSQCSDSIHKIITSIEVKLGQCDSSILEDLNKLKEIIVIINTYTVKERKEINTQWSKEKKEIEKRLLNVETKYASLSERSLLTEKEISQLKDRLKQMASET